MAHERPLLDEDPLAAYANTHEEGSRTPPILLDFGAAHRIGSDRPRKGRAR
jgi:hypothetical protein